MATTQRGEKEYEYAKLPWRATCDHEPGCKFAELFPTEQAAGHAEFSHVHDKRGREHHQGMSIIEALWVELDARIEEIRAQGANAPELLKGRAQGLAWALSHGSTPFYPTEQDVLKEAMRRWKMRHGEMPWEPTVGYKFWSPPPGQPMHSNDSRHEPITYSRGALAETRKATQSPTKRTAPTAPRSPGVIEVTGRKMSKAEQDMLREAHRKQNFTIEQCSKMFKISEHDVQRVLDA